MSAINRASPGLGKPAFHFRAGGAPRFLFRWPSLAPWRALVSWRARVAGSAWRCSEWTHCGDGGLKVLVEAQRVRQEAEQKHRAARPGDGNGAVAHEAANQRLATGQRLHLM